MVSSIYIAVTYLSVRIFMMKLNPTGYKGKTRPLIYSYINAPYPFTTESLVTQTWLW